MKTLPYLFVALFLLLDLSGCALFEPEEALVYVTFETTFGGGGEYVALDVMELENSFLVVGAAGAECDLMDATSLLLDKTTGQSKNFNHFGQGGEGNEENFFDVEQLSDNEFGAVGFSVGKDDDCNFIKDSTGVSTSRIFYTRFDSSLNKIGENVFLNDLVFPTSSARWYAGYSLSVAGDKIYIAGTMQVRNSLLIADKNGMEQELWIRRGIIGEYNDVDVEEDGEIVLTGYIECFSWEWEEPYTCPDGVSRGVIFSKIVDQGPISLVTEKYYSPNSQEGITQSDGRSITKAADDGYIIAGEAFDTKGHILLLRIGADGTEIGSKVFAEEGRATDIIKVDGGYVLTGDMDGDLFIMKIDDQLNEIWREKYHYQDSPLSEARQSGFSITQTEDEGFLIVGSARINAENKTMYMVKTDGEGKVK